MAQARGRPEIRLTIQFTNLLRAQETRPRTQNQAGLSRTLDLLFKYQEAISIDKYDLGLAKNYKL